MTDFEGMWRDLQPIGRSQSTGGYFRQPFTSAERECAAWFESEAAARGLRLERDGNGNMVAWWNADQSLLHTPQSADPPVLHTPQSADPPVLHTPQSADPPVLHTDRSPAILIGSHLDSVLDGGAFDGPLGVVSSLAAVDELRNRGVRPTKRIGIAVFAEEEGSRWPLACLGSRLASGMTTPEQARKLRDREGVTFEEALAAAGVTPGLGRADWLDSVEAFVELHVEQGRGLVDLDAPVAVASQIWPHGRYRFEFSGQANHAGTTGMEDRHDPMLTYAVTALAASKQARLLGQRATFGRIQVTPNGTNAVPSQVVAWLDARCESQRQLEALLGTITRQATERADRDGTALTVVAESVSAAVDFDRSLAKRIGRGMPSLPTQAGHDAGILAGAGIATAMLFVRNPTGISHSPAEHAAMADCWAGVHALADAVQELV